MDSSRKTRKSSEFARNENDKESSTNANCGKSKVNNFSLKKGKYLQKTDKPLFRDASVQASENDGRIPKTENGNSHSNVYSGCNEADRCCIYCKKPLTSGTDNTQNSSSRLEFGNDCNERSDRCIYCKKPLVPADFDYDIADDNSRDSIECFRRNGRIYFLSRGSDENYKYFNANSPSRLLKYSHPYETAFHKMVPPVRQQFFGTRKSFTNYFKDGRPGAPSSNRDLIRTLNSTDIHPRYFDGGHYYNSRPIPSYNVYESMVYNSPYNCNECNEPVRLDKFHERQYSKRPPSFQNQCKTFQHPKYYAEYLENSDWTTPPKIRHMDSSNDFHRDVYRRCYSDNNFVPYGNPNGNSYINGNCGINCQTPQMSEPLAPLASGASNIASSVPKRNKEKAHSEPQAHPSKDTHSRDCFISPGKSVSKEPQASFPYPNKRYSLLRPHYVTSEAETKIRISQKESLIPAMSRTPGDSNGMKYDGAGNGNLFSAIYSSTSSKHQQERSIPDKLQPSLDDAKEEFGKAHPSSAKKFNNKNWVKNTATPMKKYSSSSSALVPTYESASRNDQVPNRYSQKQEPEKATEEESKETLNKSAKSDSVENYDDADREVAEILASTVILRNAETAAPSVRQSRDTNAARKNKSNPLKILHEFRDIVSDTEAYLKPLPSTVVDKDQETNVNQQKSGISDATNHANIQSSAQEIPAKSNNVSMDRATKDNRLKKLYKKLEVKDQVYQNADDVLKEMKMVLIEKGRWQGK